MVSTRRSLTTKDRVQIFTSAGGICHLCELKIHPGERWDADHVIPRGLTGKDGLEEFKPSHEKCHKVKTSEQDIPVIAKAKRVAAKHIGAHKTRNPMQGSRASGWRKKMDGTVVRR